MMSSCEGGWNVLAAARSSVASDLRVLRVMRPSLLVGDDVGASTPPARRTLGTFQSCCASLAGRDVHGIRWRSRGGGRGAPGIHSRGRRTAPTSSVYVAGGTPASRLARWGRAQTTEPGDLLAPTAAAARG